MLASLQLWYQIANEHPNSAHGQKERIKSFCYTLKSTLGSQGLEGRIEKAYNVGVIRHCRKLLGQEVISYEIDDPDIFDHELEDAGILLPDNPHLLHALGMRSCFWRS